MISRVQIARKEDSVAVVGKNAVLNYCFNKFCPFIVAVGLLFSKFELTNWEPYVIIGMILFIDRFSFKVGYSVAFCEERGIDPSNDYKDH